MRDFKDEHRLAVAGLRAAKESYARALVECRERLRHARAWVQEAERRVMQAEAKIAQLTTLHGDGA